MIDGQGNLEERLPVPSWATTDSREVYIVLVDAADAAAIVLDESKGVVLLR